MRIFLARIPLDLSFCDHIISEFATTALHNYSGQTASIVGTDTATMMISSGKPMRQ